MRSPEDPDGPALAWSFFTFKTPPSCISQFLHTHTHILFRNHLLAEVLRPLVLQKAYLAFAVVTPLFRYTRILPF